MGLSIWEGKKAQEMIDGIKDLGIATQYIANQMGAYETPMSWPGFKNFVNAGTAEKAFPVGSQLIDAWTDGSNERQAPWDIVHYNDNGDAFLKWHYSTPTGVPFDAPEAIYYFDGTETAGDHYIGIGKAYYGWDTSKHIQITLSEAPAAGDQLVINLGTDRSIDPTNGRAWNVYGAGSTTSKQSGTTSNGTSGTSLGSTDSTSTGKANGRVNAPERAVYGDNRWSTSAWRQWANSEAAAGGWWTLQNPWDRPPAEAGTMQGFLKGCSEEFLSILEETEVVTALNTVGGYTDTTETTRDRIFLPSLEEMYIAPQLASVEGEDWDYYKELAADAGLTGKFQQGGTYPILKTFNITDKTSAVTVWLRSAYRGYAYYAWFVYSSGSVSGNFAYGAFRGCPACKIKKSV